MGRAEREFEQRRSAKARPSWRSSRRLTADDALLRAVDCGLGAVIFAAPYVMGGRHPIGRFVYLLLAVGTAATWLARQAVGAKRGWLRSPAEWILLAAVGLLVLQLSPLPPSLLAWLSPHQSQLLPLWQTPGRPGVGLGNWTTVSLSLATTRTGLASLVAYGLLFLVAAQRIEAIEDVERLLRWIGLSAVCMATFGIVQYATNNGKFFWVYEYPDTYRTTSSEVVGSFINRNHFAHFLALGIAPLVWWMTLSLRATRPPGRAQIAGDHWEPKSNVPASLLGCGVIVVLLAGLMSASRGGNAALALALCIGCVVLWRASLLDAKALGGAVAVVAVLATTLAVYGYGKATARLDDLTSGSIERLDPLGYRRGLWQANVMAIRDFPLCGAGVGTHPELYPIYFDTTADLEFTHAENGYLQVGQETGVAGLLLLAAALTLVVHWCLGGICRAKSRRTLACLGAVAAGIAASLIHSFVDFVWYIPACTSLTAILAACAMRLWHFTALPVADAQRRVALPRTAWAVLAALAVAAGIWIAAGQVGEALAAPYWDEYLRASSTADDLRGSPVAAGISGAAKDAELDAVNRRMIDALRAVVARNPGNARAQLRLAGALLLRFERQQKSAANAMALVQIRDAAFASRRAARPEKVNAWLANVLGARRQLLDQALRHTRCALRLCPLQGVGYVYLAQLSFLDGGTSATGAACLDQALRLRPYDGDVLFALADEALLAGDLKHAMRYWRSCMRRGPVYCHRVVELVAGRFPPDFLLETLQLDRAGLEALFARLGEMGLTKDRARLTGVYARMLADEAERTDGEAAANLYTAAYRVLHDANDEGHASEMLGRALALAPDDFAVRYNAGLECLETRRYAEAEKHLRWCSLREPDNTQVLAHLKEAVAQALQMSSPPSRLEGRQ